MQMFQLIVLVGFWHYIAILPKVLPLHSKPIIFSVTRTVFQLNIEGECNDTKINFFKKSKLFQWKDRKSQSKKLWMNLQSVFLIIQLKWISLVFHFQTEFPSGSTGVEQVSGSSHRRGAESKSISSMLSPQLSALLWSLLLTLPFQRSPTTEGGCY